MPMPIPAATVAMLAAVFHLPATNPPEAGQDGWRIVERTAADEVVRVNGVRSVADLPGCLEEARLEAGRLSLGEPVSASAAGLRQFSYPSAQVSFSCVQVVPSVATLVVNGPEELLRRAGYRFGWE